MKSYSDVSNFDPEFTQCDVESYSEASLKSEEGKAYDGRNVITQVFRGIKVRRRR